MTLTHYFVSDLYGNNIIDILFQAKLTSMIPFKGILHETQYLTLKAQNATKAEFANTVDPDEMAHNEPSHLDLQCLPSSL